MVKSEFLIPFGGSGLRMKFKSFNSSIMSKLLYKCLNFQNWGRFEDLKFEVWKIDFKCVRVDFDQHLEFGCLDWISNGSIRFKKMLWCLGEVLSYFSKVPRAFWSCWALTSLVSLYRVPSQGDHRYNFWWSHQVWNIEFSK